MVEDATKEPRKQSFDEDLDSFNDQEEDKEEDEAVLIESSAIRQLIAREKPHSPEKSLFQRRLNIFKNITHEETEAQEA